jgi:hypothetical protein
VPRFTAKGDEPMSKPKTNIERWVEAASDQLRRQPRDGNTWMLERQIDIVARVVELYRKTDGTRH